MNRSNAIVFLTICLMIMAGCSKDETVPPAKPAPGEQAVAKVESTPKPDTQPETKAPTFAEQVPEWRKLVRSASLQDWVKLPDDLPFYRIQVSFDTEFMTYQGHTDLLVKNRSKSSWKELAFHLYPNFPAIAGDLKYLKVTSCSVNGEKVQGKDKHTLLVVPLATPLSPGGQVHIELEFSGLIKRLKTSPTDPQADIWSQFMDLMGDEPGDWGIFAYSSGIMSLALWYPILAAYDEAGWDVSPPDEIGDFSYFDVSDYQVEVSIDPAYDLISTGVRLGREDDVEQLCAGGVREFSLIGSKRLFSLSRMVKGKGEIKVNSYALEAGGDTHNMTLHTAADSLEVFEAEFGPYPYTELDLVQTDLLSGVGGVEFPGLVTIASLLYFDSWKHESPETTEICDSRFMREATQFVVAHEVAHQWWNAVVGSHSRNHPFLDEALANYSAVMFFERKYGTEAGQRQTLFELKLPYQLHRFMGGEDLPVDLPTRSFTDLMDYSVIVYSKGGLFLQAMEAYLTLPGFKQAMSSYYNRYMFRIASREDLIREFVGEAGSEDAVRALAGRWLEGKHGDEDIGSFAPAEIVPLLFAELGLHFDKWFLDMLGEKGFWELFKVAGNILDGKEDMFEGVDFDATVGWVTKLAQKFMWDILL